MKKKRLKFDVFYQGAKIKSKKILKQYENKELFIVEKHYITGKAWWLYVLVFDVILGFLGSTYDDNKLEAIYSFNLTYEHIDTNEFQIYSENEEIMINGVSEYKITNILKEVPQKMIERVKNKRKIILGLTITILVTIFSIIFVGVVLL